ncbi:hypothetical protein II582_03405 [bacterium]|nr:hypothetical protein [bacterium]
MPSAAVFLFQPVCEIILCGQVLVYCICWNISKLGVPHFLYFLDHRDDFIEKIKNNQQKILKEYNYDTIKQQLKDLFLSL